MLVRLPFNSRLLSSSFAIGVLAYALGITFAVGVTGFGVYRLAHAVTADLRQPPKLATTATKPDPPRSATDPATAARPPMLVREASMMPTQARWYGRDRWSNSSTRSESTYRYGSEFGSSSRGSYRRDGFDSWFDSGWDRPRETYRTVCVRTCDGYYFPISFSVTSDRFERDRQACENSCGAQGRLFVYRNPGGDLEDMQDLQGKPYRQLRTAFLYRTEYVADCKCKAHPWEQQARDQHRVYALTAAKRKGDKTAAADLARLESEMRGTTPGARPTKTARWSLGTASDVRDPATAVQRNVASEAELMRLGTQARKVRDQEAAKRQRQDHESDWARDFWRRTN
jgi:Protein of unknown function (DUF2865)